MANNEVKVKFSVFNQDFNASMREMKEETSRLTKEFKLEQEQLKINGTETDKLKSKLQYLQKSHELASKSVQETEAQLKKAKEIYGVNSVEVKKLEDKLLNAQIAEQKLANEVKLASKALDEQANSSLKNASDKLEKFGSKTKDIGSKFMKGVTAPIMAVGAASMLAFNEVDSGLDTIIVKTGATGEAMEELQGSFNAVYKSMPKSAAEVGTAIGEVNTRFQETGERLEELSKEFLMFVEINGTDLNNSIGKTQKIMSQWNVENERAGDLLGLLTSESQLSGVSVDTLMDSVQQNGAALKSMGFSLENSIFMLSDFEMNGINSEVALTALKKAAAAFANEGKNAEQGLKDTVEAIKNAKSETEALGIATKVFGAKGATEMTAAIREGRMEFTDYEATLEEFGGVVKDTFESTQDPPDKMKTSLNNLNLALSDLAGVIFEVLAPAIDWIAESARKFSEWFNKLDPSIKKIIVVIGMLAAAIGPVIFFIGTMSSSISRIIDLAIKLKPVFLFLGKAIGGISLPVTLVVAAIAALVAGFIYLWNTNEGFRNAVIAAWNAIKEAGIAVWEWLVHFFTVAIPEAWQSVIDFFTGIPGWFSNLWNNIKQAFIDGWNNVTLFFTETIPAWIDQIFRWFNELPGKIGFVLGYVIGAIVKWGTDTKAYLITNVPIWINSIVNFFSQLPGKLWTWLSITIGKVVEFGRSLGERARQAGSDMKERLITEIKNIPSNMASIGRNLVEGLWNGITGMGEWIRRKIKGFADGVVSGFKKALGIHSPSRVMMELGGFTGEGFAIGIEDKISNVKKAALQISEATKKVIGEGTGVLGGNVSLAGANIQSLDIPVPVNGDNTVINFNGTYSFGGRDDIDYFMNEAAKIVQRRRG